MKDTIEQKIKEHYLNAETGSDVTEKYLTYLSDDYQQVLLERTVIPHKHEILISDKRKKAITEVTYKNIDRQLHFLIRKAKDEFRCKRVFLPGAIIINTSPEYHDYVEVRNFEVIELHHLEPLTSESTLQQKAFKVL
jgi:hypothetical protein